MGNGHAVGHRSPCMNPLDKKSDSCLFGRLNLRPDELSSAKYWEDKKSKVARLATQKLPKWKFRWRPNAGPTTPDVSLNRITEVHS